MKGRYLLELGGENTDLGKYEALELLKFKQYSPRLEFDYGNIIVISTSKDIKENIIARLSMTKRISKVIFSSSKDDIVEILKDLKEIKIDDLNFAIRQINGKNLNSEQVTLLIGEKISEKNETNLDGPQVTVLFYKNENFFISLKYSGKNTGYKKCLKHHISNRPYFSPIGIHPRIARAMINLSNCADDRTLIDPFCGTGGVLIEGADMGLEVIGIDLKDRMIEFSKGNLRHYGFKGKLINSDFKKVADLNFGSIVCDPPYGIASTSGGENIRELMERSLDTFQKCMTKSQRLVIAVSDARMIRHKNLTQIYKFEWYIHKSLTRNIIVLEKN